MHNTVN